MNQVYFRRNYRLTGFALSSGDNEHVHRSWRSGTAQEPRENFLTAFLLTRFEVVRGRISYHGATSVVPFSAQTDPGSSP
jgi:hypothetical protein